MFLIASATSGGSQLRGRLLGTRDLSLVLLAVLSSISIQGSVQSSSMGDASTSSSTLSVATSSKGPRLRTKDDWRDFDMWFTGQQILLEIDDKFDAELEELERLEPGSVTYLVKFVFQIIRIICPLISLVFKYYRIF